MIGIGDFVKVNRRGVKTRETQVLFNGKLYSLSKSGYYICSTGKRERLHVAVWKAKWGRDVPEGCVIHHLDWNKNNNSAENLICLTTEEHERVHNIVGGEEGRKLGYELLKTRSEDGTPINY